jgi:hypothetical protein
MWRQVWPNARAELGSSAIKIFWRTSNGNRGRDGPSIELNIRYTQVKLCERKGRHLEDILDINEELRRTDRVTFFRYA